MPDQPLEMLVRNALQHRASGVTQDQLIRRPPRHPASRGTLAMAVVVAAVMIVCAAIYLIARPAPTVTTSSTSELATLSGVHWVLTEVQIDGTTTALDPVGNVFIEFTVSSYFLRDPCNTLPGTYTLTGTTIDLVSAGGTQAGCSGPAVDALRTMYSAPAGVNTLTLTADTLVITSANTTLTFHNAGSPTVYGGSPPVRVTVAETSP